MGVLIEVEQLFKDQSYRKLGTLVKEKNRSVIISDRRVILLRYDIYKFMSRIKSDAQLSMKNVFNREKDN